MDDLLTIETSAFIAQLLGAERYRKSTVECVNELAVTMASSNTSEKVPPDRIQEKQEESASVKRAPNEESANVPPPTKRMRQEQQEAAILTESPLERETTPPQSPSHSAASLPMEEIPPAPPSTPASVSDMKHPINSASVDSLPGIIENASALELQQQQRLMADDMVATPAPTKSNAPPHGTSTLSKDDFSDWAVGDRYQMIRMLGRGSYGEVAQAKDLWNNDNFVAIKRITSAFDQEVDAIRLYREMHILRGLRGHECIIQLLNVVQPPSQDLNDFHDLYLVFECKYTVCVGMDWCTWRPSNLLLYMYRCGHGLVQTNHVTAVLDDGAHSGEFRIACHAVTVYDPCHPHCRSFLH